MNNEIEFIFSPEGGISGVITTLSAEPTESFARMALLAIRQHDFDSANAAIIADQLEGRRQTMVLAVLEQLEADPVYAKLQADLAEAKHVGFVAAEKAAYLRKMWGVALGEFAGRNGARSWESPYGSIHLKANPARLTVADHDAACAYFRAIEVTAPIKQELQITKVPKDLLQEFASGTRSREEAGLTMAPAWDTVTISTGVTAPAVSSKSRKGGGA